jgi:hypothetical protein
MTIEELRKFDKEALVQFIFADSVFSRERTMESLRHYEKRLRFNKLIAQSAKLCEEMQNCHGIERAAEFIKLLKKDQRISRQIDKLYKN